MSRFNGMPKQNTNLVSIRDTKGKEKSRLLNNFSSMTGFQTWYGVSCILNNTFKNTGANSIRIRANQANGSQTALRNNTVSYNLSKTKVVKLSIYVENYDNINAIEFYISNNTNYTNFASIVVTKYELKKGWNDLYLNIDRFNTTGAFDKNALIKSIQVRLETAPNTTSTIYVDSLSLMTKSDRRAKAVLTFDDGWLSEYTVAYPILRERGMVASIGAVKAMTGTSGYMTVAQLKELYDMGWDIFNHTENHLDLSSISRSAIESELDNNKLWLEQNGMTRASDIVAYPYGGYNDIVIDVMNKKGYRFGRSIRESDIEFNLENKEARVRNMIYSFPTSNFTKAIDTAIETGSNVIFVNHRVEATGTDSAIYSVENFTTVIDYLFQNSDKIDVVTLSELISQ